MTGNRPLRLCLVGLPATGKTTYIAALWGYLTSGLPAGGYRVSDFPDDPAYLNEISSAWAAGSPMPRNSLGTADRLEFTVESPSGEAVTLVFPDLPGEVFRDAVVRPFIDEDTAEAVRRSDLLLMFINGEKAKTFAALGDHEVPIEPTRIESPGGLDLAPDTKPTDFSVQDLDSDTLNSELLQRLVQITRDSGLPAILVVVAAWDANHGAGDTPPAWLEREQPMLSQILCELGRRVSVGVIGVSAQGANYLADPKIVTKLADVRAWSCDELGVEADIAGPLRWYDATSPDG